MKRIWMIASLAMGSAAALAEEAVPAAEPVKSSIFKIPGMYLIILAVVALIAAFSVVGSMTAKLKTAERKTAAAQYAKTKLHLTVNNDRFLYETVDRKHIEQKKG